MSGMNKSTKILVKAQKFIQFLKVKLITIIKRITINPVVQRTTTISSDENVTETFVFN